MKRLFYTFVCVVGLAGVSYAACTEEELQAKVMEFSGKVQQLVQTDPQKYQEIAMAMQNDLPELQKSAEAGNLDKVCEFYDSWNNKMK